MTVIQDTPVFTPSSAEDVEFVPAEVRLGDGPAPLLGAGSRTGLGSADIADRSAVRSMPPEYSAAAVEASGVEGGHDVVHRTPHIQVGTGPETIRAVRSAIEAGDLPEVYVTDGRLVHLSRVSGTAAREAGDDNQPLPMQPCPIDSARLAGLLAEETYTYRVKTASRAASAGETYEEEVTPPRDALGAVLAQRHWPSVPPLRGIVGAPVLRPDGTLLQDAGYDRKTGLYLAKKVTLDRIPEEPTPEEVKASLSFLLNRFLGDFPWSGEADKANYLGLMVTPILRLYLRNVLTPFGLVSATMPGSGKTILTEILGSLYGQHVLTWTHNDDELRKTITSVLAEAVGTVLFDNLAEGANIDSPVLARLITGGTWSDRRLGSNATATYVNDRLWLATGNNLALGGDMATRSVLVFLDPNMPNPEERTGFAIPQLDRWIHVPANQAKVLRALLLLAVDWTRAGAPRATGAAMRQFTPWAEAIGGFLGHHGVAGFLGNASTVRAIDEEDGQWIAFLAKWREKYGAGTWMTANELCSDTQPQWGRDPWDGLFPLDSRGKPLMAKSLGKRLSGQVGRFHGQYVIRKDFDTHRKISTFRVEQHQEPAPTLSSAGAEK